MDAPNKDQYEIVERHFGRVPATAKHWSGGDTILEEKILRDEMTYWTIITYSPTGKPMSVMDGRRFMTREGAEQALGKHLEMEALCLKMEMESEY